MKTNETDALNGNCDDWRRCDSFERCPANNNHQQNSNQFYKKQFFFFSFGNMNIFCCLLEKCTKTHYRFVCILRETRMLTKLKTYRVAQPNCFFLLLFCCLFSSPLFVRYSYSVGRSVGRSVWWCCCCCATATSRFVYASVLCALARKNRRKNAKEGERERARSTATDGSPSVNDKRR